MATGEQEAAGKREVFGALARHALPVQFEDDSRRRKGTQPFQHGVQRRHGFCRWKKFAQARAACARGTRTPDAFFDKNAHAGSVGVGRGILTAQHMSTLMLPPAVHATGGGVSKCHDVPVCVLRVTGRTLDAQVQATNCVMRFEMRQYLTAAQSLVRDATLERTVPCTLRVTGFDATSKKLLCSELFVSPPLPTAAAAAECPKFRAMVREDLED